MAESYEELANEVERGNITQEEAQAEVAAAVDNAAPAPAQEPAEKPKTLIAFLRSLITKDKAPETYGQGFGSLEMFNAISGAFGIEARGGEQQRNDIEWRIGQIEGGQEFNEEDFLTAIFSSDKLKGAEFEQMKELNPELFNKVQAQIQRRADQQAYDEQQFNDLNEIHAGTPAQAGKEAATEVETPEQRAARKDVFIDRWLRDKMDDDFASDRERAIFRDQHRTEAEKAWEEYQKAQGQQSQQGALSPEAEEKIMNAAKEKYFAELDKLRKSDFEKYQNLTPDQKKQMFNEIYLGERQNMLPSLQQSGQQPKGKPNYKGYIGGLAKFLGGRAASGLVISGAATAVTMVAAPVIVAALGTTATIAGTPILLSAAAIAAVGAATGIIIGAAMGAIKRERQIAKDYKQFKQQNPNASKADFLAAKGGRKTYYKGMVKETLFSATLGIGGAAGGLLGGLFGMGIKGLGMYFGAKGALTTENKLAEQYNIDSGLGRFLGKATAVIGGAVVANAAGKVGSGMANAVAANTCPEVQQSFQETMAKVQTAQEAARNPEGPEPVVHGPQPISASNLNNDLDGDGIPDGIDRDGGAGWANNPEEVVPQSFADKYPNQSDYLNEHGAIRPELIANGEIEVGTVLPNGHEVTPGDITYANATRPEQIRMWNEMHPPEAAPAPTAEPPAVGPAAAPEEIIGVSGYSRAEEANHIANYMGDLKALAGEDGVLSLAELRAAGYREADFAMLQTHPEALAELGIKIGGDSVHVGYDPATGKPVIQTANATGVGRGVDSNFNGQIDLPEMRGMVGSGAKLGDDVVAELGSQPVVSKETLLGNEFGQEKLDALGEEGMNNISTPETTDLRARGIETDRVFAEMNEAARNGEWDRYNELHDRWGNAVDEHFATADIYAASAADGMVNDQVIESFIREITNEGNPNWATEGDFYRIGEKFGFTSEQTEAVFTNMNNGATVTAESVAEWVNNVKTELNISDDMGMGK